MKHTKAIYYNKTGERCFVKAEKLADQLIIVELKNYTLLDSSEEFELSIVDNSVNSKKSHFRLKTNEYASKFYSNNDSEEHDNKIISLNEILNKENLKIVFEYNDFNDFPHTNKELIKLNDYVFKDEVTKETEIGRPYARFDIFGTDNNLCITKNKPEVIIEVIDENFHDKDLFNFLIDKTLKSSTIVIYYFIKNENRYNSITLDTENKKIFRISCFIKNGKFFYCGLQLKMNDNEISNTIDNKYRYFNFIEQTIIKPIKKGINVDIKKIKKSN